MARKMNAVKLSHEVRGQTEVTNRRFAPQVVPYLMQPCWQPVKISPPRRRMQIAIEIEMRAEIPGPVKIIHTV
ncbi:MAG: hypothetical protein ACLP2Y_17820 [Limisphaerales bacterium]